VHQFKLTHDSSNMWYVGLNDTSAWLRASTLAFIDTSTQLRACTPV